MLTTVRFLMRSLRHHWRMQAAVGGGAAVACAVLTGSLIVGDSMRASLRALAMERLGRFELALAPGEMFRAELAGELGAPVAAALLLDGSAAAADSSGRIRARAGGVQVVGIGESFLETGFPAWEQAPDGLAVPRRGTVWINRALARELDAKAGDAILVSIERWTGAPRESYAGRRAGAARTLRLDVAAVIPDRGPGLFSLRIGQAAPRLAYLDLDELSRRVEAPGQANVLLAAAPGVSPGVSQGDSLAAALRAAARFEDLGLRVHLREQLGYLVIESRQMVLRPEAVEAIAAAAAAAGLRVDPALTHLAERIAHRTPEGPREIPYSTIAALDPAAPPPFGPLRLVGGAPAPALAPGEILINEWAAQDLGIDPAAADGKDINLDYFTARPDESVAVDGASFTLRGVVALAGPAADPHLTPEFPGITGGEIQRMRDWDPPFDIDLSRIRDRDEEYWDLHRATPKAFVGREDGKRYFESRFGPATAIRIAPAAEGGLEAASERLLEGLRRPEALERLGFRWRGVRAEHLGAVTGGTGGSFEGLFIGFSSFLIASAAILTALLFGLGIDSRAREIGLLLALGFRPRRVRGFLLAEAGLVAGAGGLAGVGLAAGYATLILEALQSRWRDAVRAPYLVLDAGPVSLAGGYAATAAVVIAAIFLASRRLGRASARGLLAGMPPAAAVAAAGGGGGDGGPRSSYFTAGICAALAAGAAGAALLFRDVAVAAFFAAGTAALAAGLALFSAWLRSGAREAASLRGAAALFRLGCRGARRAPGRSLLTAGLVAAATFVLAAVAASRHDPEAAGEGRDSGTGGFALVATAEIPLALRFDTAAGCRELGLIDVTIPGPDGVERPVDWEGMRVFPFRVRPGDDLSCLNLYAPKEPRLLGAPRELIRAGRFRFAGRLPGSAEEEANPWLLLDRRFEDGAVAAIADANSARWILKKSLGEDVVMRGDGGEEVRLRLVATLSGSIFQGELLISEERFIERFPARAGWRFFLVDLPQPASPERIEEIERGLEAGLQDHGFDAVRPASLLASFLAVEGTYLATFQTLGGLGLILGTLGLGVVLLRGVVERRGELALLKAIGFRRRALAALVLAEDLLLLGCGIAGGTAAALLAVLPRLAESPAAIPWASLAALLALVLAAGLLSATLAIAAAARSPILEVLRSE